MQDNNYKDFDLVIKDMLEGAEMKPSRRVWKGVSSRLDAAAAPKGTEFWTWMRWAGVSCAAVAAVFAGLLFIRHSGQDDTVLTPGTQMTALADLPSAPDTDAQIIASAESLPQSEAVSYNNIASHSKAVFHHGTVSQSETTPSTEASAAAGKEISADNLVSTRGSAESPENVSSTSTAANSTAASAATGSKRRANKDKVTVEGDPFALMVMEDSRSTASRRMAMYAKGAIGGNESNTRLNNGSAMLAPGTGLSTGITELSESVYGVPFTIGLGVRVPLIHQFSVGTGIDYSLLTRTFSGKYTKVEDNGAVSLTENGSVSHALHYIGIPLNLFYDIIDNGKIRFYTYGMGEVEYCLSSKYTLFGTPNIVHSEKVKKLQFSIGFGLGAEFRLSNVLGLYLDPGLRYYFPCDQPKSVRTDKPVMANFDAGLRFTF